jgi:soluble lytic murein transglycosylase
MMIAKTLAPKRFFILLPLLLAGMAQAWAAHPEEAAFLAARDAYVRGERAKLERALAGLKTHPLAPWAEHFRLALRLEDGSDAGIAEFLQRHDGSYLAEKTRALWLKALVRKEDWQQARLQYAQLRRPDTEATCLGIDAGLRLGEPEAPAEARAVLNGSAALTDGCTAPLGRQAASGALPAEEIRARLRRQLALGKFKEARLLAGWLADAPAWKSFDAVADHPARHLAKLPQNFADSARERELAMFAVLRMAKSEVRVAAARWQEIESRFADTERGFVWGRLALGAALGHLAEATEWFERAAALGTAFDDEQQAWRVRAALRSGDWPAVARAIDALPPHVAAQPEWSYWRGRAHVAAGMAEAAKQAWTRIAGQPNFYGILAAEALGQPYALPPRAAPPSAEELAAAAALPGLERGLALIRADMRLEGIREWNWTITGLDDRQLLAAAEIARRSDVIDRAINTADRTRGEHDFALRYPTPFYSAVEPRAREVGLDPAWVYGLMRQESRFIMDAKSSVGAKGLMQLMPATAKWVAKKIGMAHYHPGKVAEMDTNVTLGTNYLRMVMDSLDSHPVLASAAYNAGPGRARKWRAERPIEGAIYAETIPFNETRDYVKKVMANAVNYAALLGGPNTPYASLGARLGTIRPRGFGDNTAEDLP